MDMSPVLQTSLDRRNNDGLITRHSTVKSKLIYAAIKEIEPLIPSMHIPTVKVFQKFTKNNPSTWDPVESLSKSKSKQ